jgi:beta-glucanase (GH16 family)
VTRLIVFCLAVMSCAQKSEAAWVLTSAWSAGEPFETSEWTFERGFLRNAESQYYTGNSYSNFQINALGFSLIGRGECVRNAAYRRGSFDWRRAKPWAEYTSASIISSKAWQNVKVEIVANVRDGAGGWPAIWLRSPNSDGVGEVDLMEHLGREPDTVHATVHYGASFNGLNVKTATRTIREFQGKDVTYTATLDPERLKIEVDHEGLLDMDRRVTIGRHRPLQQPYNLVLNVALGGAWSGPIDDKQLPAVMTVKSIKVWEWRPGSDGAPYYSSLNLPAVH